MKYDIEQYLSPHFRLKEFLHNGSLDEVDQGIISALKRLAHELETIRHQLGDRAIIITSGFRTKMHNLAIGGAPKSQHLYGNAADIEVAGMMPRQVQEALKHWKGGLGSYPAWTHVDLGIRRRWSEVD